MSMLLTMDLQAAVIAHLHWKSKLTDFFYGVEKLTLADVPDHTHCDFGKWLYDANGLKDLAGFPDVDAMEALHKEVHDGIRKLVAMSPEQREGTEGQQALAAFKERCDRLVELLERMENQAR
jgi:hypothetical protein